MKNFRNLLLIFILPILVIGITMELLLRNIPNRFQLQNDYILESGSDIETLIIGSSHTEFGINPKYLESAAFNLSNVSQPVDIDLQLLKHYQKFLPNLKTVIIRLSYTTLFERLNDSKESWRMKDYTIYQDLESDGIAFNSEILSVSLSQNINRIYDYYVLKIDEVKSNSLGWGTEAVSSKSKNLDTTGEIVAKKHTIENEEYFEANQDSFKAIVELAQENSIEVIVITLPAYETYFKNMEENQIENTIQFGKTLAKTYPNVRYLNFLEDKRFNKSDFYDADHLNEIGARKFSRIINDSLSH
ncbi:hypothetical protein SAMN03097699_1619 [Flavobacteriaceae bacterium MAR_2010_188]|nr:hypothetical protein SAMN03097699_1619 [Flavobacteriaceae bacterium MAR_2010_188]